MKNIIKIMNNRVFTGNNKYVYAAGDIHGDYDSFNNILSTFNKLKDDSLLVFLGDYADRGYHGLEIIAELNELLSVRKDIVALKGNHELYSNGYPSFSPCDLINEAEIKYDSWEKFYNDIFNKFLGKLYIAAIINNVLFIHAGISSVIKTLKDLENPDNEECLLWSDPSLRPGEHPNLRGAGIEFGQDITEKVLSSLELKMLVRSHEPNKAANGPHIEHNGKVITINACTSYREPWKPFLLKINTTNFKQDIIFF